MTTSFVAGFVTSMNSVAAEGVNLPEMKFGTTESERDEGGKELVVKHTSVGCMLGAVDQ